MSTEEKYIRPDMAVSVGTVQAVLGSSSSDVATLCTSPLINMWSRCKPIGCRRQEYDPDDEVNGQMPQGDELTEWGLANDLGVNKRWSIEKKVIGGAFDFQQYVEASKGARQWEYVRPNGEANLGYAPYRLHDFRGYWHEAVCPFTINALEDSYPLGEMFSMNFGTSVMYAPEYVNGSVHYKRGFAISDFFDTEAYAVRLGCVLGRKNAAHWGEYVVTTMYHGWFGVDAPYDIGVNVATQKYPGMDLTLKAQWGLEAGDTLVVIPFIHIAEKGTGQDKGAGTFDTSGNLTHWAGLTSINLGTCYTYPTGLHYEINLLAERPSRIEISSILAGDLYKTKTDSEYVTHSGKPYPSYYYGDEIGGDFFVYLEYVNPPHGSPDSVVLAAFDDTVTLKLRSIWEDEYTWNFTKVGAYKLSDGRYVAKYNRLGGTAPQQDGWPGSGGYWSLYAETYDNGNGGTSWRNRGVSDEDILRITSGGSMIGGGDHTTFARIWIAESNNTTGDPNKYATGEGDYKDLIIYKSGSY